MTKEQDQAAIEAAALDACVVPDSNGEPAQDQWAYDRFKAGVAWRDRNPSPAVKGLVEALNNMLENFPGPLPRVGTVFRACVDDGYNALAAYEESIK